MLKINTKNSTVLNIPLLDNLYFEKILFMHRVCYGKFMKILISNFADAKRPMKLSDKV